MASLAEDLGFKPRLAPLSFSKVVCEIKLETYYKVCVTENICVWEAVYIPKSLMKSYFRTDSGRKSKKGT